MITPNFTNRGLAKIKFFVVYVVSVLLLFLVLSSFFKIGNAAETGGGSGIDSRRAAIDDALHRRLQSLQSATIFYLENERPAEGLKAVTNEKKAFQSAIDSIRQSVNDISNIQEKASMLDLLSDFTSSATAQERLMNIPVNVRTDSVAANGPIASAEMDELKQLLAEKEKQIAALEQQVQTARQEKNEALASLQRSPATQPVSSSANSAAVSEWKERYNRLKAASDRSSTQLEALRTSYQQVVEDNRRLITQLQAARAGKN